MRITAQQAIERLTAFRAPAKSSKAGGAAVSHPELVRCFEYNVYLLRQGKKGLVVPADDEVMPVLGETEQADYTLELPPNVEEWLTEYADEVDWLQNGKRLVIGDETPEETPVEEPNTEGRKDIPYMVKTKWGQGKPYNNRLTIEGSKCLTGCSATSIAQIMHYWGTQGYHRGCTKVIAYQWSGGRKVEELPPITSFDYSNLPTGKPKTTAEINAVATLMEYVSKAIKSDFRTDSTGAWPSVFTPLLRKRLRLGDVRQVTASSLGQEGFAAAIYDELAAGRPVEMSGRHANGGHSFVCDGYRVSDGKFHFNWGWEGDSDGWYAMTALNPGSRTYNSSKSARIGICPAYKLGDVNGDGRVNVSDVMAVVNSINAKKTSDAADVNSDGKTDAKDVNAIVNHILGNKEL